MSLRTFAAARIFSKSLCFVFASLIELEVKTYLLLCLPKILRWKYAECIEAAGEVDAVASPADGLYYPDWDGEEDICANNGKQPVYMTNNPTIWMHNDLKACCTANFP